MEYLIEHTELTEKVYQLLKKMILDRDFAGGQRLDLNDLSRKMKISRTPLKDAVNRLVTDGLVEVKPRSGTFVTEVTVDHIEEVMEIRLMIELWCMSHLTGDKIRSLADSLSTILVKGQKVLDTQPFAFQDYVEIDVQFHIEIVKANGNPRMLQQYRSLNSFLNVSRIYSLQSYDTSMAGHLQHKKVIEALQRGDLAEASSRLEGHLKSSRTQMVKRLRDEGGVL